MAMAERVAQSWLLLTWYTILLASGAPFHSIPFRQIAADAGPHLIIIIITSTTTAAVCTRFRPPGSCAAEAGSIAPCRNGAFSP